MEEGMERERKLMKDEMGRKREEIMENKTN